MSMILALTSTGRDQVTHDHVFLHAHQLNRILPRIAASLNTLVVSWNDAADSQLSVFNDAWVIPCKRWSGNRS
jgi:hypothetical protein